MRRPPPLIGLLFALACALILSGSAKASSASKKAARVVKVALSQRGVPYRYAGSSPGTGFDCSGFTRWVYGHVGVSLPHSSYAQFNLGRRVSVSRLKPGDLLFFYRLGHVGIYVGHGTYIDAPQTGEVVHVHALSSGNLDGARRMLG